MEFSDNITMIVIFMVSLFISIGIHEMMHALTAYKLGDDLAHSQGRISLNPLRHIDPMLTIALPTIMVLLGLPPILAAKPVPINPNRISGEELGLAAVGIAGPLTNLALASLAAVGIKLVDPSGIALDALLLFVQLNIGLFVFNMLPIPPLDGSRVLYAVAPGPVQRVMEQMEQMGLLIIILFLTFLLPVISPLLQSANQFLLNILL